MYGLKAITKILVTGWKHASFLCYSMGARWFLRFLRPKLELPSMSAYSPYLRCLCVSPYPQLSRFSIDDVKPYSVMCMLEFTSPPPRDVCPYPTHNSLLSIDDVKPYSVCYSLPAPHHVMWAPTLPTTLHCLLMTWSHTVYVRVYQSPTTWCEPLPYPQLSIVYWWREAIQCMLEFTSPPPRDVSPYPTHISLLSIDDVKPYSVC